MAETQGNPLALLELPRGLSPSELAGGFGLPGAAPLSERIEESFRRQLEVLPEQSRRLLLLAAAEPYGDLPLVWRAAGRLGIPAQAARDRWVADGDVPGLPHRRALRLARALPRYQHRAAGLPGRRDARPRRRTGRPPR